MREIMTAVYVIPTEMPEADATLAWDKTTMVLAFARAGGARGIGWTYAALAPDPDQPGLGLTLRDSDAEHYRYS